MAARSSYKNNPARIPALGARAFALLLLSLLLMFLDHRDNHLDAVRNAISAAVYPMRVIVAAPVNLWAWASDLSKSKKEL